VQCGNEDCRVSGYSETCIARGLPIASVARRRSRPGFLRFVRDSCTDQRRRVARNFDTVNRANQDRSIAGYLSRSIARNLHTVEHGNENRSVAGYLGIQEHGSLGFRLLVPQADIALTLFFRGSARFLCSAHRQGRGVVDQLERGGNLDQVGC
jgi:hypothetical protein